MSQTAEENKFKEELRRGEYEVQLFELTSFCLVHECKYNFIQYVCENSVYSDSHPLIVFRSERITANQYSKCHRQTAAKIVGKIRLP